MFKINVDFFSQIEEITGKLSNNYSPRENPNIAPFNLKNKKGI